MPATYDVARDEIYGLFNAAWDAGTPPIIGTVPVVYYDGIGRPDRPDPSSPWAEVRIRHSEGRQAGFGGEGRKRFEKSGRVIVSVFSPLTQAPSFGERLARVARSAFEDEDTQSGVWFVNVRMTEVRPEGPHYRWDIIAEFRYDEFVG